MIIISIIVFTWKLHNVVPCRRGFAKALFPIHSNGTAASCYIYSLWLGALECWRQCQLSSHNTINQCSHAAGRTCSQSGAFHKNIDYQENITILCVDYCILAEFVGAYLKQWQLLWRIPTPSCVLLESDEIAQTAVQIRYGFVLYVRMSLLQMFLFYFRI